MSAALAACVPYTGPGWDPPSSYVDSPLTLDTETHAGYARSGQGEYNCQSYTPYSAYSWKKGPTSTDCENRNNDPEQAPGTRLALADAPTSRCVGGCALDVQEPLETVPGRVQGQPVVFYRWTQSYTGETCDGTTPAEETDFSETEDERQCIPSQGICLDENDNQEYCTFNPDGTPSTCVPATDYDNDGTPDVDDPYPDDTDNGDDSGEGDEKDNSASGGATCGGAPACSGDGIACAILFQTWKTRCAVENLDGDGGVPGGEEGGVDLTGMGNANDFGDAGVTADDAWRPEGEGDEPELDTAGWLGGSRACPSLPVVEAMGVTLDFNNPDLCSFMSIGANLILVFAALASIRIYSRAI